MNKLYLLFLIIFNIACFNSGLEKFTGNLFYSCNTNHLYQLNLSSLEENTIYEENEAMNFIAYSIGISNQRIIFTVFHPLRAPTLKILNLVNNETNILREGFSPTYIDNHNILFFYMRKKPYGNYDSMYLYAGKLDSLGNSTLIFSFAKPDSMSFGDFERPVVQISNYSVVFRCSEKTICEYNINTKEITRTDLNDLFPLAWREKSNELICRDRQGENIVLVNWLNKKQRIKNVGKETDGWTYIKEYDILLFSKSFLEWGILYYYNFEEDVIEKLKFGPMVRTNAVFFP